MKKPIKTKYVYSCQKCGEGIAVTSKSKGWAVMVSEFVKEHFNCQK